MIVEFFKRLVRQRVQGVQIAVKSKTYSAQARAKGKAASAFNRSIDGAGRKAKNKAMGVGKGAAKKKGGTKSGAKSGKGEKKMGWFGGKKDAGEADASQQGAPQGGQQEEVEFGDKTQFLQVAPQRAQECVGWIVSLNGNLKGQDFRLVTGKNVIGTAADCDVVLTDQFMSARHAVIRHEEGSFVLVDLDSTNGTFVNDQQVSKEELIDNDRIRLGKSDLKFKSLY